LFFPLFPLLLKVKVSHTNRQTETRKNEEKWRRKRKRHKGKDSRVCPFVCEFFRVFSFFVFGCFYLLLLLTFYTCLLASLLVAAASVCVCVYMCMPGRIHTHTHTHTPSHLPKKRGKQKWRITHTRQTPPQRLPSAVFLLSSINTRRQITHTHTHIHTHK
jgi:hypothetical protein